MLFPEGSMYKHSCTEWSFIQQLILVCDRTSMCSSPLISQSIFFAEQHDIKEYIPPFQRSPKLYRQQPSHRILYTNVYTYVDRNLKIFLSLFDLAPYQPIVYTNTQYLQRQHAKDLPFFQSHVCLIANRESNLEIKCYINCKSLKL